MPTVLILDVSLSMARTSSFVQHNGSHVDLNQNGTGPQSTAASDHSEGTVTKKSLAVRSVYRFLDELGYQAKLEHVALVIFSSLWEVAVPFTRDYDSIKSAVDNIVLYDKTCLDAAFNAAHAVIQDTWSGTTMPCQAVIITDGQTDISQQLIDNLESASTPSNHSFHMHCLSAANEFCCSENLTKLNRLMDAVNGTISVPDGVASVGNVEGMINKYIHDTYKIYSGTLFCGNLSNTIQLHPAPTSAFREDDFTSEELEFPHEIGVVGFISQSDVMSPGCISRHLVLPLRDPGEHTEEEKGEEGKIPSMTVLLHGALKVESYVAIVKIRDEWFGMLHSWADSKKKSNLVLSVFKPGLYSVPWLGSFKMLNCLPNQMEHAQQLPALPVPVTDKKSYSGTSPSWLRQTTLQADVQKLMRYGRKLPEKLNVFYKELNRIHKAAVSIGFHQLLIGISQMLERECSLLPPQAHPDAFMQLSHAAGLLNKKEILSMEAIIRPLETNFQNK